MTTLRAVCPACTDEVDLTPEQITLHLPDPAASHGSAYAFRCPACADLAVKPADARTVELLLLGEVRVHTGRTAPWERGLLPDGGHPELPADGPAFTLDDVLALHELLETADWFDRLLALTDLPEAGHVARHEDPFDDLRAA